MRKTNHLLLSVLFLLLSCSQSDAAEVLDMINVKEIYQRDSSFKKFPFAQYAAKVDVGDVKTLEKERRALQASGYDDELFVKNFLSWYLSSDTFRIENLDHVYQLLELGETFLLSGRILEDSTFLYETLSDMIFTQVAASIKQGVETGQIDRNDPEVIFWIKTLASHQYLINFRISDIEKGIYHLKTGNFTYLFKRVWTDHKGIILHFLTFLFIISWLVF